MKKLEEMSFEEAYCELEAAVERLETGDLTLEEAIALYERGIHLTRHCNAALDAAELQVEELLILASPPG
ncbi:MAG: exodeoxyribonuclease VII small subunit [Anaerolineae bacterium]|jgi:exodeoxyribonuclease VII small subunit